MSKSTTIILALVSLLLTCSAIGQNHSFPNKVADWYYAEKFDLIIEDSAKIINYAQTKKDSTGAELLFFLSDAYLAFDNLENAIQLMEKELAMRYDFKNKDNLIIADLSANIAYYHALLKHYELSINYYKKAIEIYKTASGNDSPSYIDTNIFLNQLLRAKGEYEEANKILKTIESNTQDPSFLSKIHREQIDLLIQEGKYNKAEKKAIELEKDNKELFGKESLRYLEALNLLALIKSGQSNYAEAELYFSEAIYIARKLSLEEYTIDNLRNNLAVIYSKIGLYEESNIILNEIVTDEASYDNAITLRNMGINYAYLNEIEKADVNFQKAINTIVLLFSKNSIPYIENMKDYANTVTMNINIDTTINILSNSLNKAHELLKTSNPEFSKYELHLGKAYFRNNNFKKAQEHLGNAYKLRSKYLSKNHPLYAESTKKLAELAWANKSEKEALAYYKDTFRNYFNQIEAYFPALSEQQKANFYGNTLRPTFEEFNTFAITYRTNNPELLGDIYNYQLATKGLIMYASAKARENIFKSNDPALISMFENWITTKELIAKAYSLTEEEIKQQGIQLDSLAERAKDLEKTLSRESATFSSVFENKTTSWQDIQQQLKPDEAAIEVIRFKEFSPDSNGIFLDKVYYAALLIDKNSKHPELILIENGSELENKFMKNYKNAIKYKITDKYSYTNYWAPIAEKTAKYNKIYFSPDGIYNQISINSLYNSKTKKHVLEEQNIQMLTNTKDLIAIRNSNTTASANSAQLFGFPNYNKGLGNEESTSQIDASQIANNVSMDRGLRGSLSRYIRGNSLVTLLPGTKEEVEKINILYSQSNLQKPIVHLSNEADEQQLKSVDNPKVLHIATHGFFLEDNSSDQENSSDKYNQNPLLKSGLIMAGANSFITSGIDETTGQDGILTAYEAMNMNLTHTDLVVLSACETGLGDLKNGEGVYGLRRAFFVAGAKAIIMSLWSVDDAATQFLMSSFYEEWLSGKSKDLAFKNAQLMTKQKYEDPFYWAAFVMVGN